MILDSALISVLIATGGYYALPISILLFADAVWWRRRHPEVARSRWLALLRAPPLIIIALGAWWSADSPGVSSRWLARALYAVAVLEGVFAAAIYRKRDRWWPGVSVLVGFGVLWTLYLLLMALLALSGDSL